MSKRYLTKSRFKLAVECPTKLYYAGKENEYKNNMQGANTRLHGVRIKLP